MKTKTTFLEKQWAKIRKQISKLGQVPLAQKILFYKVFIRPLLIFNWVKGCTNDLKAIEREVLKQIFGEGGPREVYSQYSDIDISCYMKVQEFRWSRKNSLSPNFLKSKLRATKDFDDPFTYFVRALKLPKVKTTLRHRRSRATNRISPFDLHSPISAETLGSQSFVDSLIESTSESAISGVDSNKEPRRSLRLANKLRKFC